MADSLNILVKAVQGTLNNPAANPAMTAFVVGAGFCLALILVVALMALFTPKKKRVVKVRHYTLEPTDAEFAGDESVAEEPSGDAGDTACAADVECLSAEDAADDDAAVPASAQPARRTLGEVIRETRGWRFGARTLAIVFSVPVLILFALGSAWVVTSTDDYCTKVCHNTSPSVKSAVKLDHARCVQCHETPGFTGAAEAIRTRGTMLVSAARGGKPDGSALIDSASCLRCHESVLGAPVIGSRGVKVSHKEPVAAGMTCGSCHPSAGHTRRRTYSMTPCLSCHGNRAAASASRASAECETCHVDGIERDIAPRTADSTATLGSGAVVYPIVAVGKTVQCGACHDEKRECDSCHGFRMPHDRAFLEGGHARVAAFERKEACFKCHSENECSSGCHINFPGHLEGWKEDHKKSPRDAGCSCHAQRSGRTGPMCPICH